MITKRNQMLILALMVLAFCAVLVTATFPIDGIFDVANAYKSGDANMEEPTLDGPLDLRSASDTGKVYLPNYNGYYSWTQSTKTLVLSNANLIVSEKKGTLVLLLPADAKVEVAGTSTLTANSDTLDTINKAYAGGIYCDGNLTFTGSGKLVYDTAGVYFNTNVVDTSWGDFPEKSVADAGAVGIYCKGTLTVGGGVTIESGSYPGGCNYTGAEVFTLKPANIGILCGSLNCSGTLTLIDKAGIMHGNADCLSCGLYVMGDSFVVDKANVDAEVELSDGRSYGIYSKAKTVSFTNSTILGKVKSVSHARQYNGESVGILLTSATTVTVQKSNVCGYSDYASYADGVDVTARQAGFVVNASTFNMNSGEVYGYTYGMALGGNNYGLYIGATTFSWLGGDLKGYCSGLSSVTTSSATVSGYGGYAIYSANGKLNETDPVATFEDVVLSKKVSGATAASGSASDVGFSSDAKYVEPVDTTRYGNVVGVRLKGNEAVSYVFNTEKTTSTTNYFVDGVVSNASGSNWNLQWNKDNFLVFRFCDVDSTALDEAIFTIYGDSSLITNSSGSSVIGGATTAEDAENDRNLVYGFYEQPCSVTATNADYAVLCTGRLNVATYEPITFTSKKCAVYAAGGINLAAATIKTEGVRLSDDGTHFVNADGSDAKTVTLGCYTDTDKQTIYSSSGESTREIYLTRTYDVTRYRYYVENGVDVIQLLDGDYVYSNNHLYLDVNGNGTIEVCENSTYYTRSLMTSHTFTINGIAPVFAALGVDKDGNKLTYETVPNVLREVNTASTNDVAFILGDGQGSNASLTVEENSKPIVSIAFAENNVGKLRVGVLFSASTPTVDSDASQILYENGASGSTDAGSGTITEIGSVTLNRSCSYCVVGRIAHIEKLYLNGAKTINVRGLENFSSSKLDNPPYGIDDVYLGNKDNTLVTFNMYSGFVKNVHFGLENETATNAVTLNMLGGYVENVDAKTNYSGKASMIASGGVFNTAKISGVTPLTADGETPCRVEVYFSYLATEYMQRISIDGDVVYDRNGDSDMTIYYTSDVENSIYFVFWLGAGEHDIVFQTHVNISSNFGVIVHNDQSKVYSATEYDGDYVYAYVQSDDVLCKVDDSVEGDVDIYYVGPALKDVASNLDVTTWLPNGILTYVSDFSLKVKSIENGKLPLYNADGEIAASDKVDCTHIVLHYTGTASKGTGYNVSYGVTGSAKSFKLNTLTIPADYVSSGASVVLDLANGAVCDLEEDFSYTVRAPRTGTIYVAYVFDFASCSLNYTLSNPLEDDVHMSAEDGTMVFNGITYTCTSSSYNSKTHYGECLFQIGNDYKAELTCNNGKNYTLTIYYTIGSGDFPTATVTVKDGYEFDGWFDGKGDDETLLTDNKSYTATQDRYLYYTEDTLYSYAQTSQKGFSINYDLGGAGKMEPQIVFNNAVSVQPATPTLVGYTFGGWYSDAARTTEFVFGNALTASVTAYAKVTKEAYNVNYDVLGGEGSADNLVGVQYNSALTLPTLTKTGYVFGGWTLDGEAFSATTIPDFGVDGETITLKAVWTAKHFTLKFDVNGGNAATYDNVTADFGASLTLPTPTHATLYFVGWCDDRNGNGTTVSSTMPDLSDVDGRTVTLYAQWVSGYPVTFNANGHGVAPEKQLIVPGSANQKATEPTKPTCDGYIFEGWFVDSGCQTAYDFSANVSGATTLYAKWTAKTDTAYRVEHYQQNVANDDYTLIDTTNMTGTTAQLTAAVAKTFEGFAEKASITQVSIAADGSTVVKIYYDRKTYSVQYKNGDTLLQAFASLRYGAETPAYNGLAISDYQKTTIRSRSQVGAT